jgi:hypothetical protein
VGKGLNELLVSCGLDEAAKRKRIRLRENQCSENGTGIEIEIETNCVHDND